MKENQPSTNQSKEILKGGVVITSIPMCVGKNIRQMRKELRMTQKDLAQAIGCEASYISHVERVSRNISLPHLFQLADVMKTTPASLVTDQNNSAAKELTECLELLQKLPPEVLAQAKEYLLGLSNSRP